jgi:hypothetical protein
LQHLANVPIFAGGPTHGRCGRRYVFTPAQYGRLVESLSCPGRPSRVAAPLYPRHRPRPERLQRAGTSDPAPRNPTGPAAKANSGNAAFGRARAVVTFATGSRPVPGGPAQARHRRGHAQLLDYLAAAVLM